jgi:hypothetical protein
MIFEHLKEAKEDHDNKHAILDAKMDKCNNGIHRIFTALETIAKEKVHLALSGSRPHNISGDRH